MLGNQKIKKAIKEGNLGCRIATTAIQILGFSNRNIAGLEIKNKVFSYLKRNYAKTIPSLVYPVQENFDDSGDKYIWICWFQGIDNAPELVKKCYVSIIQNMGDKEIIIISKENMGKYVDFPEHIMKKWESGLITDTKMSDFLRMELLIRYGGLWMDSTIFLSDKIPDWVYRNSLFMYSIDDSEDITRIYNNYFIYAKKDHPFLKTMRDLNYYYWKQESKIRDYFQWHLFATLVAPYYQEIFDTIVFMPDTVSHMLGKVIFRPYDIEYWNTLKTITPIHKLSNKFQIPKAVDGTFYSYFMNSKL